MDELFKNPFKARKVGLEQRSFSGVSLEWA